MKKPWFMMVVIVLVLTACSGAQAGNLPAPTATAEAVPPTEAAPPTATAAPPTATLLPPTATAEPPTPVPFTPTPAPVDIVADVPYIDDGNPAHYATIYRSVEVTGPYPTVVIYHSGIFWYGDEIDIDAYETVARFFAGLGYAVVVPAYRLSQTDPYPAAVEDAFCVLAWVHAAGGEYGLDAERVATLGLDAGADLAALTGVVDDPERFLADCPHPLPAQPWVRGVVAIGGYYDLSGPFAKPGDAWKDMFLGYIRHYMQAEPDEAPELYAEASPIAWVEGSEPPFAVIFNKYYAHHDAPELQHDFVAALEAVNVPVQVTELANAFWMMFPYHDRATTMVTEPTLADYGFPEAAAFLDDVVGLK